MFGFGISISRKIESHIKR